MVLSISRNSTINQSWYHTLIYIHSISPTKEIPLPNHTLEGTSGILIVGPHIPIMADTIPSNRGMGGSLSRVPTHRRISIRSRVAILVDWSLSSNSRGVSGVTLTHISRCGMGRKNIGVLVSVGLVL